MVDFIQITTGTIMTLFTVEQVFITDTTGIHPIIPTILILHIIMIITTPLFITETIIHIMDPDTTIIICLIILIIQIVMTIIPTRQDIEVVYLPEEIEVLK